MASDNWDVLGRISDMRKNDLIKLLENIKGNPEVALWNGHVEDYMHIGNLVEVPLVKKSYDFYVEMVQIQDQVNRKDWDYKLSDNKLGELKNSYKRYVDWQMDGYVTQEDIKEKRYTKKRLVLLEPKTRGKSSFDRSGSISY